MTSFDYPVRLTPDEDAGIYTVTFRDVPEAITWGRGIEDALWQATDCVEEAIAGRIRRGDDIPSASRPRRGERTVAVPAGTAAKAALYVAMKEAKLDPAKLARRLKCDPADVIRMLDPRRPARVSQIEAALRALGKRLTLSINAAA
jgi:antitoxin HicB